MKLYAIQFTHYSPKDNKSGILGYLVAENDEEVYEFIKSEPYIHNKTLYNSYKYNEVDEGETDIYDENYNVIGTETFRERIIKCHGDMNDEYSEVSDLYYGATQYGWELVYENITYEELDLLRKLNILVN